MKRMGDDVYNLLALTNSTKENNVMYSHSIRFESNTSMISCSCVDKIEESYLD
jgi:hypothetical protein